MDLAPSGSEMSTNSLLELLTVYTAVPAKVFATWSELRAAAAACFVSETEANGGGGRRSSLVVPAVSEKLLAKARVVSPNRVASSAPNLWQCWWMKVERDKRGLEGLVGSIV